MKTNFWGWAAISFAYMVAYFERSAPQAMLDVLSRDLATSALGVGALASGYFYGYTLLQIPAGLSVDTFGVRKVILASLAISCTGTLMFSLSPNLFVATISRTLIACGDTLVFVALIKFVSLSCDEGRFGLMSGLSQVSGYIGGVLATTPFALALSWIGWRQTFGVVGLIGFVNLIAVFVLVPTIPPRETERSSTSAGNSITALLEELLHRIKLSVRGLRGLEAWGCALTFSAHFVALTSFSGVWGIAFLMHGYGLTRTQASAPMLCYFLATILGTVFFGYAADRTRSLLAALIRVSVAEMILLCCILPAIGGRVGIYFLFLCMTLLGAVAGAVVPLVLKCLRRIYSADRIGIGGAINSTVGGILAGSIQVIIGRAIQFVSPMGQTSGQIFQTQFECDVLIVILVAVAMLGAVGPLLMRRAIES